MPDQPLLTVKDLAAQLGLPESTVRYYRDAFLDHVPAVGTGRRRRYPPAAVAVLRSVAEGYAAGLSRAAILRELGVDEGPAARPARAARPAYAAGLEEEISNLDLLAAIVEGEREQREALWQMAREVVRLTEVLDGQQAALAVLGPGGAPALPAGDAPALTAGPAPSGARAEAPAAATGVGAGGWPWRAGPAVARQGAGAADPSAHPSPHAADLTELARLREELEAERQLVERLREARLRLEQRAVAAEGAARERRGGWRASVLGRLFGGSGAAP